MLPPPIPPPIHVLRGILRRLKVAVPTSTTTVGFEGSSLSAAAAAATTSSSSPLSSFVLQEYRDSQTVMKEKQDELRQLAFEYYTYQKDLAERVELQRMDTGAEVQLGEKEMSRRAAARAGLKLPDLNPDL